MAVPVAAPSGALPPLVPAEPSLPTDSGPSRGSPATALDGADVAPGSVDRSGSRRRLFTGSLASSAAAPAAAASRRPTPAVVAASEGTDAHASRPGSGAKRQARGASVESTQRKRDAAVLEEEIGVGDCGEGPAGEHLTLEFLEENGYLDMPIQVGRWCSCRSKMGGMRVGPGTGSCYSAGRRVVLGGCGRSRACEDWAGIVGGRQPRRGSHGWPWSLLLTEVPKMLCKL